jgi:hypothetical protein
MAEQEEVIMDYENVDEAPDYEDGEVTDGEEETVETVDSGPPEKAETSEYTFTDPLTDHRIPKKTGGGTKKKFLRNKNAKKPPKKNQFNMVIKKPAKFGRTVEPRLQTARAVKGSSLKPMRSKASRTSGAGKTKFWKAKSTVKVAPMGPCQPKSDWILNWSRPAAAGSAPHLYDAMPALQVTSTCDHRGCRRIFLEDLCSARCVLPAKYVIDSSLKVVVLLSLIDKLQYSRMNFIEKILPMNVVELAVLMEENRWLTARNIVLEAAAELWTSRCRVAEEQLTEDLLVPLCPSTDLREKQKKNHIDQLNGRWVDWMTILRLRRAYPALPRPFSSLITRPSVLIMERGSGAEILKSISGIFVLECLPGEAEKAMSLSLSWVTRRIYLLTKSWIFLGQWRIWIGQEKRKIFSVQLNDLQYAVPADVQRIVVNTWTDIVPLLCDIGGGGGE